MEDPAIVRDRDIPSESELALYHAARLKVPDGSRAALRLSDMTLSAFLLAIDVTMAHNLCGAVRMHRQTGLEHPILKCRQRQEELYMCIKR